MEDLEAKKRTSYAATSTMLDDDLFRFPAFEAAREAEEKNRPRDESKQLLKKRHIEERQRFKAQIVNEVTRYNGMFITRIEFNREYMTETVKEREYPTFHLGSEASYPIETQLLQPTDVQAIRSNRSRVMVVYGMFSQEDRFLLRLRMDEKGCWGFVMDELDWKSIKAQIGPSLNPGMSIWACNKGEQIVFMFWLPRWITDSISPVKSVRKARAEPRYDRRPPRPPKSIV